MGNGIRIVEKGTTVDKAADYQVVLDSRWPLLQIQDEINIDVTLPIPTVFREWMLVQPQLLGYAPIYEFIPDPTVPTVYTVPSMSDDYQVRMIVTDKNVFAYAESYFGPGYGTNPTTALRVKGVLRIYTNNLRNQFKSDALNAAAQRPSPNKDLGLKAMMVNANGHAINDSDFSEFSVDTDTKALAVHQVAGVSITVPTAAGTVIEHDLGYLPTYWAFTTHFWGKHLHLDGSGNWDGTWDDDASGTDPIILGQYSWEPFDAVAYADTINITLYGAQTSLLGEYAFIIFHDPVLVAA
jgi:hypothetical protein